MKTTLTLTTIALLMTTSAHASPWNAGSNMVETLQEANFWQNGSGRDFWDSLRATFENDRYDDDDRYENDRYDDDDDYDDRYDDDDDYDDRDYDERDYDDDDHDDRDYDSRDDEGDDDGDGDDD
ncbi:MAG: hypothetical protein AAFS01_09375 [Pseudomonadota bacterium]